MSDKWMTIDSAPTLTDEMAHDCRIVMAYFGVDEWLYGYATVGYFFQWDQMDRRLPSGWPLSESPTHWIPLPSAPKDASHD